jgi:MerR family transcriptional regulator, light-induced transcriptional regulator
MRRALDDGLSAAEAARDALEINQPSEDLFEDAEARLLAAIHRYDEDAVQAMLDESLTAFGLEATLRDLILPILAGLGRNWDKDALGISQEHFASNLIRGRLLSLARLWGRGGGPLALLACAPGEAHDISLLAFGLLLRSYGWRILFLGADTPISTLTQTAKATRPALVVLTSFDPALLEAEATALSRLSKLVPLFVSGPGASDALCTQLGVRRLDGDLVAAASEITRDTHD